jgi:hypothetical protein
LQNNNPAPFLPVMFELENLKFRKLLAVQTKSAWLDKPTYMGEALF